MIKKVASAQGVITPEPIQVGVKVIGPSPSDDVNDRAGVAPKLGQQIARDDAKFLTASGFSEVSPGWGCDSPGISASLLSVPSSRKLLFRSREPFTDKPCSRELLWVVPGESS